MAHPLAVCPNGHIFETHAFDLHGSNTELVGNIVTCPKCGAAARVADGVFDATAEAMKIIRASDFTRTVYEQFHRLVEEARAQNMAAEEFVERSAAIDPKLGEAAKKIAGPKVAMAVALTVTLAALNSCKANLNVDLDVNQLIEQVITSGVTDSDHGTKP